MPIKIVIEICKQEPDTAGSDYRVNVDVNTKCDQTKPLMQSEMRMANLFCAAVKKTLEEEGERVGNLELTERRISSEKPLPGSN